MSTLDWDDLRMMADAAERLVAKPEEAGWATYAELGWLALPVDAAHGGLGGGLADLAVIMRAAGAALLPDPLISTLILGGGLVARMGSAEQKDALLPAVAAGAVKLALAHAEREGGQDRRWVHATATRDGGSWRLNGAKTRVTDAPGADRIIVSARTDRGDTGLFLLRPADAILHPYEAVDGRPMADLELRDCMAEQLGEGDACEAIDAVLDRACVATCLDAAGAMLAANATTLDYLKTRRQFGTTLGSFQVLQHRMADMVIAATRALAMAVAAAAALDRGEPNARRRVSAAKVAADSAGQLVGEQAVQLHGGIGVTEEYRVGRYLKRLLMARMSFGDTDWHLARLQG